MSGWWDKSPLATEDVRLREDLGVRVTQQAASRPARSHAREQAWSNGTISNASRGTGPTG